MAGIYKHCSTNTLNLWHDFTKRVCFHRSRGSKDLHVPFKGALKYHLLRVECFKVTFPYNHNQIPINGWKVDDDSISISWDEEVVHCVSLGKGRECKCDVSTSGCKLS